MAKKSLKGINAWDYYASPSKQRHENAAIAFAEGYKIFLHNTKTPVECIAKIKSHAQSWQFRNLKTIFNDVIGGKTTPDHLSGCGFYATDKTERSAILGVFGKRSVYDGMNLVISHVDSPRLDLKPTPFYAESKLDTDLIMINLQPYGGITPPFWVSRPLALHGVIVKGGNKTEIINWDSKEHPKFLVQPISAHLEDWAKLSAGGALEDMISSEYLDVVAGGTTSDNPLEQIFTVIKDNNGLSKEDFQRSELSLVPYDRPFDSGIDHSLVSAYGQDDKGGVYTSLRALHTAKKRGPKFMSLIYLSDKEETGSEGSTGAQSNFLMSVIKKLVRIYNPKPEITDIDDIIEKSNALCADMTEGLNPLHGDDKYTFDETNNPRLNFGVVLSKQSGMEGQYDSSVASPEYMSKLMNLCNNNQIVWQTGLFGSAVSGAASMSYHVSRHGFEIAEVGIPTLSLHAPFETTSKIDVYCTYRLFTEFFMMDKIGSYGEQTSKLDETIQISTTATRKKVTPSAAKALEE